MIQLKVRFTIQNTFGCEQYNLRLMTDLFHGYEQQYLQTMQKINNTLEKASSERGNKKEIFINDIKIELQDCENSIKLMETQLMNLGVQTRGIYKKKTKQYHQSCDAVRKNIKQVEEQLKFQKMKELLLDDDKISCRQQLIKQGQIMCNTNSKLKNSVQLMHENQDISNNVGVQLQDHSHRLINSTKKTKSIRFQLNKSERTLHGMMMNIRKNKFMLAALVAFIALIGIIALAVHFNK